MDGCGRPLDNVFLERLWRTDKYEEVYLHDYVTVVDLGCSLEPLRGVMSEMIAPAST